MTKRLKILLYVCITGVLLGVALMFGTAAQATSSNGTVPKPQSTTSITEKPNGETITNTVEKGVQPSDWFAPGGIVTISIGGLFLIVKEIKSIKQMDVEGYKTRAETAENKANTETQRLAAQIERLEQKLDAALKDVESKHDEMMVEVAHRRKLELLLAQHGITPPTSTLVVVADGVVTS